MTRDVSSDSALRPVAVHQRTKEYKATTEFDLDRSIDDGNDGSPRLCPTRGAIQQRSPLTDSFEGRPARDLSLEEAPEYESRIKRPTILRREGAVLKRYQKL